MFCNQCGQELEPETRFCVCCGAEQFPAQEAPAIPASPPPVRQPHAGIPKSSKGKYLLFGAGGTAVGAILLAVILLIAGVFSSGGGKIEGPGFNTPEEAAEAYLAGLREQDIDAMVSAFAVESYVEHYDFEAMVERLRSYNFIYEAPFPNSGDYTRQLNIENRRKGIVNQIIIQYMLYNSPDAFNNGAPVTLTDPEAVSDFIKDFERDTEDYAFKELTVTAALSSEGLPNDADDAFDMLMERLPKDVRKDLLDEVSEEDLTNMLEMYLSDTNQDNIEKQAKTFGAEAEDIANVAIFLEADGDTWMFCPQAVRYNGKWYIQTLSGNLANLCGISVYSGGIVPIG